MPLEGGNEVRAARSIGWESESAWRRFCGFLDFSQDAVLDVQRRLLQDQIRLLKDSPIGQRFMSAMKCDEIDEFRRSVPLTTYADYAGLFQPGGSARALPGKYVWTYTATGPGQDKWIPYTARGYERLLDNIMAT
ncbi:MAG: GH3 auxin-responsive promoter family protein, partial [Chloroflexi bacterium]|nr:GH3 auxin-responsive promoter family protein [Chloroflexota bacterium]